MHNYFLPDPGEKSLHSTFLDALIEELGDSSPTTEELTKTIKTSIDEFVPIICEAIQRASKSELAREKQRTNGFQKRNRKRWKSGFDIAHTMLLVSQDLGSFVLRDKDNTVQNQPAKLHAIAVLHAKSLRVGREVLCLLENGFPDGALGRWRTLHETSTVASFLSNNDESLSVRFLLARTVQSYKAALQYKRYEERANLLPFAQDDIERLKLRSDEILSTHGEQMKDDWGWASAALKKNKVTFADIEAACQLDHWRPRYKWASEDTHGNYKPNETHLAMNEAKEHLLVAGRSNSGMKDPGQMLGCSIQLAATSLLGLNKSLDVQVGLQALGVLNSQLSDALILVTENAS